MYSYRRQAQLVQLAREHGVEDLLPETTKGAEYRLAHRVEHGLRVKGTGVGQKVKGHIHERHMIAKYVNSVKTSSLWALAAGMLTIVFRMEERRKAMLEMPKLIKAWKRVRAKKKRNNLLPKSHVLTRRTGGKEELDQMAQINQTAMAAMEYMPFSGGTVYTLYFIV